MANIKISNLPVAVSVAGSDSFPVVQSGVTKQATKSVLFASPTFTGTTAADIVTASGNVTFDGGTFVFNESGADKDARFEGDTDANLLFLDASTDRVGIGTSTPSTKLHISGTGNTGFTVQDSGGVSFVDFVTSAGTNRIISGLGGTANLGFYTASTLRATIDDSGNVGIGTSSPSVVLHVKSSSGVIWSETTAARNSNNNYLSFRDSSGEAGYVGYGASDSRFYIWNVLSGDTIFGTNNTERARITSVGDFIHQVNGTAPTLSTNSTMSFELTSNTSLKIVVRGTDGTTRSVSLTLS